MLLNARDTFSGHRTTICRLLTLCPVLASASDQTPPAFPRAEGFGSTTRGGRGVKVLLVTTLADYHPRRESPIPGSLRAAVDAQGPRNPPTRHSTATAMATRTSRNG